MCIRDSTTTEQSSVPAEGVAADVARRITVVCPSRDLSYAIARARELNVDTTTADFGNFSGGGDLLRSAAKWIDLSDSETIWRE